MFKNNMFKNKKKFCLFLIVFILILFLFFFLLKIFQTKKFDKINEYKKFPVSVHFIDVGQGDCELISCYGKNILIDAGEEDKGPTVTRYIKEFGIDKLDYIIATHPHTDHIGGLSNVIKNFKISNIIMPQIPKEQTPTNSVYYKFMKNIFDKKINILNVKPGENLNFGKALINFVGPHLKKYYSNINNYSIGFLFKYKDVSCLLCGDMEYEAEKDLIRSGQNIKATILKLNHHGSKSSNSFNFLKAVSPTYCVAEVGNNNPYNHPNPKIFRRLKKLGIKNFYRTDFNGNIVFCTDGKEIKIYKQREE